MKEKTPYNAGELYVIKSKPVMICGHIWWPVEQRNAYHCVVVDQYGEPTDTEPQYIWDMSDGKWPVFTSQEKAA